MADGRRAPPCTRSALAWAKTRGRTWTPPNVADIARDLHDKLAGHWRDVDFDWGRRAASNYTEDAIIEEFHAFRRERGPRVVLHAIVNFICDLASDTEAPLAVETTSR